MTQTHVIDLDGSAWLTAEDFYIALLAALGAPGWHGHDLDALNDSLSTGDINRINPPLSITLFRVGADG